MAEMRRRRRRRRRLTPPSLIWQVGEIEMAEMRLRMKHYESHKSRRKKMNRYERQWTDLQASRHVARSHARDLST